MTPKRKKVDRMRKYIRLACGVLVLAAAIASGFIQTTEAGWQTIRLWWPPLVGLTIGAALILCVTSLVEICIDISNAR